MNEREQAAFGAALRRERERRSLSLETIAEQTKVSTGLLGGLERGDLSRWPAGIFRRAFVRSYAEAVGLDATEVLREFVRMFPDAEADPHDAAHVLARSAPPSRARLLGASFSTWRRLGAAITDVSFTAFAAAAGYITIGLDLGLAGAALVQALAVALGGGSLGMLLVQPRARGTASADSEELRIQEASPVESHRPVAPAPPSPARAARPKRGHRADRRDTRGAGDGWSPHR